MMPMMRPFRRCLLAALLAISAPAGLAGAQEPAAASLSEEDRADLARIEVYLNTLTTVEARFTQVSETQGVARGDFYLRRPGRMRIEYDPPVPYLYVADGFWLTFWDAELEQRSDVLLGSTLADFIVREDIALSGDIRVTDVSHVQDTIEVDLVQAEDPAAGQLTLVFQERPIELLRWRVVDAQGLTTDVYLSDARFGVPLDNDLFVAPRPRHGG